MGYSFSNKPVGPRAAWSICPWSIVSVHCVPEETCRIPVDCLYLCPLETCISYRTYFTRWHWRQPGAALCPCPWRVLLSGRAGRQKGPPCSWLGGLRFPIVSDPCVHGRGVRVSLPRRSASHFYHNWQTILYGRDDRAGQPGLQTWQCSATPCLSRRGLLFINIFQIKYVSILIKTIYKK